MSTIINNPRPIENTIIKTESGGWAMAVIILLLVVGSGAAYLWVYGPSRGVNQTIINIPPVTTQSAQ